MAFNDSLVRQAARSKRALEKLEELHARIRATVPQQVFFEEVDDRAALMREVRRQERAFAGTFGKKVKRQMWEPNRKFYGHVKREAVQEIRQRLKG